MKKAFLLLGFILSLALSIGCCAHGYNETNKNLEQQRVKKLVNHLSHSTVAIADHEADFVCSGFWINKRQFITAKHCISNPDDSVSYGKLFKFINYEKFDNRNYVPHKLDNMYSAMVTAYSSEKDIAALTAIENVKHNTVKVFDEEIWNGLHVHSLSNPGPSDFSYIDGVVSQTRRIEAFGMHQKVLQITLLGWGGSSGGGCYSEDGRLIGMFIISYSFIPGMKLVLHRDEIVRFLKANQIEYSY